MAYYMRRVFSIIKLSPELSSRQSMSWVVGDGNGAVTAYGDEIDDVDDDNDADDTHNG